MARCVLGDYAIITGPSAISLPLSPPHFGCICINIFLTPLLESSFHADFSVECRASHIFASFQHIRVKEHYCRREKAPSHAYSILKLAMCSESDTRWRLRENAELRKFHAFPSFFSLGNSTANSAHLSSAPWVSRQYITHACKQSCPIWAILSHSLHIHVVLGYYTF